MPPPPVRPDQPARPSAVDPAQPAGHQARTDGAATLVTQRAPLASARPLAARRPAEPGAGPQPAASPAPLKRTAHQGDAPSTAVPLRAAGTNSPMSFAKQTPTVIPARTGNPARTGSPAGTGEPTRTGDPVRPTVQRLATQTPAPASFPVPAPHTAHPTDAPPIQRAPITAPTPLRTPTPAPRIPMPMPVPQAAPTPTPTPQPAPLPAPVQRSAPIQKRSAPTPAPTQKPLPPATTRTAPSSSTPAVTSASAPPPPAFTTAAELDDLARKLVAPLSRLLRAELRSDRERIGRLRDHGR
ncbi:hypothetical protein ACFVTP_03600 [Streptomyces celluloflavus]|uniref:hypothetical protein n=1 Tax=Streptomyces celluloflavus TaxID=58344 RepID=UPI0036DEE42A